METVREATKLAMKIAQKQLEDHKKQYKGFWDDLREGRIKASDYKVYMPERYKGREE